MDKDELKKMIKEAFIEDFTNSEINPTDYTEIISFEAMPKQVRELIVSADNVSKFKDDEERIVGFKNGKNIWEADGYWDDDGRFRVDSIYGILDGHTEMAWAFPAHEPTLTFLNEEDGKWPTEFFPIESATVQTVHNNNWVISIITKDLIEKYKNLDFKTLLKKVAYHLFADTKEEAKEIKKAYDRVGNYNNEKILKTIVSPKEVASAVFENLKK